MRSSHVERSQSASPSRQAGLPLVLITVQLRLGRVLRAAAGAAGAAAASPPRAPPATDDVARVHLIAWCGDSGRGCVLSALSQRLGSMMNDRRQAQQRGQGSAGKRVQAPTLQYGCRPSAPAAPTPSKRSHPTGPPRCGPSPRPPRRPPCASWRRRACWAPPRRRPPARPLLPRSRARRRLPPLPPLQAGGQ